MRLRATEKYEVNKVGSGSRKQIADWLGISDATFYRWLRLGLIRHIPISRDHAREIRSRIEKAKEQAHLVRPSSQRGRTSTREIAAQLMGGN